MGSRSKVRLGGMNQVERKEWRKACKKAMENGSDNYEQRMNELSQEAKRILN